MVYLQNFSSSNLGLLKLGLLTILKSRYVYGDFCSVPILDVRYVNKNPRVSSQKGDF